MAAKKNNKGKFGIEMLIFLVIAVPVIIFAVLQQTNWFNQASGPSTENLNSTTDRLETLNADGTMGPRTSYGNWSNSLPSFLKGKLVFAVTDPPTSGTPTRTLPSQAQGKGREASAPAGQSNGPQTVSALNLTISKVEVHIAYQGTPGDKSNEQPVNHWETLALTNPVTVDLVQLAKTKDFTKLGITTLAAGRYTEVRLYLSSASAKLSDNSLVTLKILGKNNIVRVIRPFTVIAGKTTTITLDFDAQHSVIKAGNIYHLKPVVARFLEEHKQ